MKILVTGVAGFIGMHLCLRLLRLGYDVVGIDNMNNYYDTKLKDARLHQLDHIKNFQFEKIDIVDNESLCSLFERHQFKVVCNLAAQAGVRYSITNPDSYIQSNIIGFFNILEACRNYKIENLLYASSSSVYGKNTKLPYSVEDKADAPVSLYAATKKSNELMAHAYSHLYGFKTTGLRFFTVYGPWGRPDMAPFLFTDAILNDRPIKVFNNGQMSRDFTYIDDVVEGIVSAIEHPSQKENYRIFNLGDNHPVCITDFIGYIEQYTGKQAQKELFPMQQGDVCDTYADISESTKELHYIPKIRLEEGIKKFVDWFKNYNELIS